MIWNFVIGNRLSLRTPILATDRKVNDLDVISDGTRSLVFLGSARTVDGEQFLFENGIASIHDGSVPTGSIQNPLMVLEDIYGFDSRNDSHRGEYREFIHNTAVFFRHRDVQDVIIVDDSDVSFQAILFKGVKADSAFVICEVYSDIGRGLARIKFTSALDDVEWIFDSVSTIVVNK